MAAISSTQNADAIVASPSPTAGSSDVVVVPTTATLIPIPMSSGAPYGNGTMPSGVASSSGVASPTTVLPTDGYAYKRNA